MADFTDTGATLAGLDQMTMRDRIAVARTKLAQCVGIPESSIVGFRWVSGFWRVANGGPREPTVANPLWPTGTVGACVCAGRQLCRCRC